MVALSTFRVEGSYRGAQMINPGLRAAVLRTSELTRLSVGERARSRRLGVAIHTVARLEVLINFDRSSRSFS